MPDQHGQRETTLFLAFAASAGLGATASSIEARNPPEPDILWRPFGRPAVAFELVEVIDQGFAERTWTQIKLKRCLEEAFTALEPDVRAQVEASCAGSLVHVVFDESATFRSKQQSVERLLANDLATIPSGWEGLLRKRDGAALPQAISEVRLRRLAAPGVHFDVDAVGSLADPTVSSIRGKWAKNYRTKHPIELLAYYELQPEGHEELWRRDLEEFLRDNQATAPFRRVWVFDCGSRQVRFTAVVATQTQFGA